MARKQYKAISSYTPNFNYTYEGMLKTELFQKPKIETPALSDFAEIRQGIRSGEHMNLVQPLTSILSPGTANCEPTYTGVGSITNRKIITSLVEFHVQWCKKEFQATASVLSDSDLIGDGLSGYELGGRLRSVMIDEILEALRLDLWKLILFGNSTAPASSFYSSIDGFWTTMFDSFANYCVKPVSNALPNQHNSVLAADEALNALRSLYENSPILLKTLPQNQRVFWVTGSMWDNLYTSYESKQYGTELQFKYLVDGVAQLSWRGVPVIPLWIADQTLENDTDNPYYDNLRHFAVHTIKANHIIGVENARDLNNVDVFFDRQKLLTKFDGEMRVGYQFVHCDLQAITF